MSRIHEEHFDRRELLRRGTGAVVGLGASSAVWPVAPAWSVRDRRLSALARELDGDVVVRGSPRYRQARLVWNARFDAIRPLAVAYAETTADLQRIIRWAKRYDVHVALRSSGHSFAGYSTTTGLVADLSRMSAVQLLADGTATVDAGANRRSRSSRRSRTR